MAYLAQDDPELLLLWPGALAADDARRTQAVLGAQQLIDDCLGVRFVVPITAALDPVAVETALSGWLKKLSRAFAARDLVSASGHLTEAITTEWDIAFAELKEVCDGTRSGTGLTAKSGSSGFGVIGTEIGRLRSVPMRLGENPPVTR